MTRPFLLRVTIEITGRWQLLLAGLQPASAEAYELLFELILIGVIGMLFLGGFLFLLRAMWRVLKKRGPQSRGPVMNICLNRIKRFAS
jgi:hypothetical protein